MSPQPISEPTQKGCSRIGLGIFGFIFAAVGSVLFWFLFISPVWGYLQAQQWPETQCTVTASKVEVHHDSEGNTYEPVVTFEYMVGQQRYTNDRISFLAFDSSSRRKWANELVKKYNVGSVHTGFYDPADPAQAVLDRSWKHSNWIGLFPALFLVVGLIIMAAAVFQGSKAQATGSTSQQPASLAGKLKKGNFTLSEADDLDREMDMPQKLKPKQSRILTVVMLIGICLFWNGIVSIFVVHAIGDGFQWFDIFLGLFLTPFVLVGLVLVIVLVHQFLNLFNPKVEIGLSSGAVPIGGEVDIAWEVSRGLRKIQQLKITIEGEESATYVQGTDTHTDTELFAEVPVADTSNRMEINFGSTTVQIPEDTMHTFEAEHNQITWTVHVQGSIPLWPDVDESFAFRVKPI